MATKPWSDPQPIDSREIDLTEPPDWRLLHMTEADVVTIESELRISVPGFLRRWLIENPFCNFPNETRCLICHRDRLIQENVELRREGYYGRKWPDQLLYLGDDWAGGAYFVDTTDQRPSVYWYDWEQGEGDTVLSAYSEKHLAEEFVDYIAGLSK